MADKDGGSFGRGLMQYVASKLPYSQPYDIIDDIAELNPKYKQFYKAGSVRDDLLSRHSISTSKIGNDELHPMASIGLDKNYHAFMYANVDYDKGKRLRDYRVMAQFAEVADALDEICDDFINKDDEGHIATITLCEEYDPEIQQQVTEEFKKFASHFEMEDKGWEYCRQLLVDGEIYFEHVVHKDHVNAGILGIINIPADLVDPIYDNVQNLMIKGFLLRKPKVEGTQKGSQNYGHGGNTTNNAAQNPQDKIEHIPLDKNQVSYVHSGIWNEVKTLRLPFIEFGRRAYRQLSLIEDAIIIYRLVRAPERLVFNVDVGNMPPPKAEAYLKRLMQQYWSRKTYDSNQSKTIQAFTPQSMLDAFWFAKRAGSDGTSVDSLPGGANLGELDDLKYFRQKLYRALKVPVQRLDPESQADAQGATIMREELKFARFIIRLQQQFATGLKNGFVTHLKLRGLWEDYDLKENKLRVDLNPPTNFHELRTQQTAELKWNNYATAIGNPQISDTWAKKHMLKMSDAEIKHNRELLRKDKALAWELAQIEAAGPNWRDQFEAGAEPAAGGDMGGAMPPPAGGGLPPDLGPAPAMPGGEEGGAAPAPTEMGGAETALPQ